MSELLTTLHKKGDTSVDVYPNIKSDNIPNNAVTSDKISANAVTTTKIVDNAVTLDKLDATARELLQILNSIYDTDEGRLSVGELSVGSKLVLNGSVVTPLYRHSIQCTLKDNYNNAEKDFAFNISTADSVAITKFSLIEKLVGCDYLPIVNRSDNTFAYISYINNNDDILSIYTNVNDVMTELDFDEIISCVDAVTPIYSVE